MKNILSTISWFLHSLIFKARDFIKHSWMVFKTNKLFTSWNNIAKKDASSKNNKKDPLPEEPKVNHIAPEYNGRKGIYLEVLKCTNCNSVGHSHEIGSLTHGIPCTVCGSVNTYEKTVRKWKSGYWIQVPKPTERNIK